MWIVAAVFSAIFAGVTAILSKCGMKDVNSDVATAIRTGVVFVFAWLIVLITGAYATLATIDPKSLVFLILSGLATGGSWLCYYYAIQQGQVSVVVPIDKLSIVLTVVFSVLFLKEKPSAKTWVGLALLATGSLCMAIFT